RIVQPPPALLADPLPQPEGDREHQRQPARDDAGGDGSGMPRRGERNQHGGQPEVERRVEQQRARVQPEHRQPGPRKRLVPAEEALLEPRRQARAHAEPEPDGQRQEPERDEARGARDVPGDRGVRKEAVHRCTESTSGAKARRPNGTGSPVVGTYSAASSGKLVRCSRASSRLEIASAVACASTRVGSGPTSVTASGPSSAGEPVAGSIRWCSERPGPKRRRSRPDVATPPSRRPSVPSVSPGGRGSATATRHSVPSGGEPWTAMSPPRSTRPPSSSGAARVIASSARAAEKPLPIPPRSRAAPRSTRTEERSRSASSWAPARQPAARRPGRTASSSKVRSYPAATRAGRIVGSKRPSVSSRASTAARTAVTRRSSTATHSPEAAFTRERSLRGSNRESTDSHAATSTSPAVSAFRATSRCPGRTVTPTMQL